MRADQITIPEPCHQDWDAMRPEGQRRFCDQCTKHVHDLSAMTDAQARSVMASGDVCVRFTFRSNGELVHRPLATHWFRPRPRPWLRWLRRAALTVLGASMLSTPALAGSAIAEVEDDEGSWLRQALSTAVDWLQGDEEEEEILMGDVAYEPPPPPPPEPPVLLGEPVPVPDPPPPPVRTLKGKPLRVEAADDEATVPPALPSPEETIPELSE